MQQKVQHKEKKLWKKRTKVLLDYVFVVKVPYSHFDHIFEKPEKYQKKFGVITFTSCFFQNLTNAISMACF